MTDESTVRIDHDHAEDEITYCAVHPDRETGLQCNRCGRYMCSECAVPTPVGYRCKECVRAVENTYYNTQVVDYALIFGITAVLSAGVTFLISLVGFFILIYLLGALIAGGAISEVVMRVVKRRKGRYNRYVAWAGVLVGVGAYSFLLLGGLPWVMLIYAPLMAYMVGMRFPK